MLARDTGWTQIRIQRIEDLKDGVRGAGLTAVQMTAQPVTGSLLFRERDGILFSSGRVDGQVALTGPLSNDKVTLGVGLRLTPGSRHWLREVSSRTTGVFCAGDVHDALYHPGSLYFGVTLSLEKLEEEAGKDGMVLDRRQLGGTRLDAVLPDTRYLSRIVRVLDVAHSEHGNAHDVDAQLFRILFRYLAREPKPVDPAWRERRYARIVGLAREYIHAHIDGPIAVDDVASAARTSRRTLYRAFTSVLGQPPHVYVHVIRLHRVREGLVDPANRRSTIASLANPYGVDHLSRFSGAYREHFGEMPSQTRSRCRNNPTATRETQFRYGA
jgi:AraC-like DNA-binding protein